MMEAILTYLLKANIILVLFFAIYRLLLSRQQWFQVNRALLLTLPLLVLLTPLLKIEANTSGVASMVSATLPSILVGAETDVERSFSWVEMVAAFYGIGVLIVLGILIYRLSRVLRIRKGKAYNGYQITRTSGGSFSFFNWIYLNDSLDEATEQMVLRHEKVHADQWHSADILWYELLTALFWFNPVIWLLKRELRDTHEFIADRLMSNHFRQKDYMNALLNATFNTQSVEFLPMFNNSQTLLKRVKMMKIKQIKIQRLRYLLALPLVAAIVFASACTEKEATDPQTGGLEEPATGQQEEPLKVAEQMPEFAGGQTELFAYLGNNLEYPEAAKSEGIEGRVVVNFIVDKDGSIGNVKVLKGIGGGCDDEAKRVVSKMPNWSPGVQEGKKVRVNYSLPIQFALRDTSKSH